MKLTRKFSEGFASTKESDDGSEEVLDVIERSTPAAVLERSRYIQHFPSRSRLSTDSDNSRRVLTTASLLAFCFFTICGGPIGSEDMVLAGGPLVGLTSMLVFPIIFLVPLAYMVTELATALPVSGGHAYWIALAFGPSWGFQAGYWSWVSNCVDCAMYAAMTISSLVGSADGIKHTFWAFLFKATFALVLAVPGIFSLRLVGNVVLFFSIFVLIPYGVVSLWGATSAQHWHELLEIRRAVTTPTSDSDFETTGPIAVQWRLLINTLVWSYSGYTNLSMFAAHVENPVATYRKVLWASSLVIPLAYFVPFACLTAVHKPDWRLWEDGSLGDVAKALGGEVVAGWIMVVDLVCSAGLYICGLTASVYLANGMAKQGIAPTTLGLSSSSGTPYGAVFCSLAVILVVVNLEFDELLLLANALGGLESVAFILAALRLRFKLPNLHRPIKFCGNAHPIVPATALLLPLGLYGFVLVDAFTKSTSAILTAVFLFIGLVYARQADYAKFREEERSTLGGEPTDQSAI